MPAVKITCRIKGAAELASRMKQAPVKVRTELARILYQEAEGIMTQSKMAHVPVDTGALRSTGHVQKPEISSKGQVRVRLGYGGPSARYAIYVHENLKARHVVGGSKYLEKPTLAWAAHGGEVIAAKMNAAFAAGKLI